MKAHPENNMPLRSKKDLEIILSKLQNFEQPSWELEQYATPSNIAAEWVWSMALKKEVQGTVMFDDNGNIGKRYRRQDEIGTPHTITIDFDSLQDNTVTLRDRDTTKQERIKIDDLPSRL